MNPPSEHCRIEIKLPNDVRALGAVRGALEHTARHLGFPQDEEALLAASVESVLEAGMASLTEAQEILVNIHEHPGRLEIEVIRPAGRDAAWVALRNVPGVDRVEQETSAGQTRVKLLKRTPGDEHTPRAGQ